VARAQYAGALSVLTDDTQLTPDTVRAWLAVHDEIVHCTIEVHVRPASRA